MPCKILLVDDDENILFLFSLSLEEQGFFVFTAETGEEALRIAGSNKIDIVFLDYKLADINGIELARRLKQGDNDMDIFILTGSFNLTSRSQGEESVRKILLKPLTDTDLISEINAVLGETEG